MICRDRVEMDCWFRWV